MMKKERILVLGMAAVLLSGCGSKGDTGDSKEGENGEITITVAGYPSAEEAFESAIEGFHKKYPEIRVEYNITDTTSHHQALSTALASNTGAADVAMVEGGYIAQYSNSKALINLLEEPYNAEQYKDDFVELKWNQAYSVDGKRMVGLPWDVGPATYFYRRDVFKECGLPSEPEEVTELMSTWEGVLEVAEAVSIPGERWLVPDAVDFYRMMFANRDYYNEDLTLRLDRDGDTECLEAIKKIRENGWDMKVNAFSSEANAGYSAGTCVSVPLASWFGVGLKTNIDPEGEGNWAAASLPGGIKSSNCGGSYLVIPEQSEHKEEAWKFIEYMLCTAEAQNTIMEAVDYFPAYTPAYEDPLYEEEDPYFGGQKTRSLWVDQIEQMEPVYSTMMDVTAEECITSTINGCLERGDSPKEMKKQLAEDIEKAAAELKEQWIQIYKDAGMWEE